MVIKETCDPNTQSVSGSNLNNSTGLRFAKPKPNLYSLANFTALCRTTMKIKTPTYILISILMFTLY